MSAAVLAELLAAGVTVEASDGRVRLREPRPGLLRPEHAPAVRALKPSLSLLAAGAWRQDLATWPDWRRFAFEERAAIREYDGRQPRDLAERCAYLEAAEAPELIEEDPEELEDTSRLAPPYAAPANDVDVAAAPVLAMLLEVFPGARVEVRHRQEASADHQEERDDAPQGFVHSYRPPPEQRAVPPFRWSTPPPTTRAPAKPHAAAVAGVIEATDEPRVGVLAPFREPPAGPIRGPAELSERRAARHGCRIDAHGSWLEAGEASRAPHLARFAAGHEPSEAEEEARRAQLDAIEADSVARLGPLRGTSPLPEPSPDVLPERVDAWRAAYRRRLAAGLDPESAARLTITTHGPRPA